MATTVLDAIQQSTVLFNGQSGKDLAIEVTSTGLSATYNTDIHDVDRKVLLPGTY